MKHRILTLALLLSAITFAAEANPVDMNTAREVALKFVNANTKTHLRGAEELQLVTTYSISRGDAAFHIFNTPNGFVIVSADDCATPILGYSDEGHPFDPDNVPVQLQDYLQGFVEQIEYGIENRIQPDEATVRQWELVRSTGRMNESRDGEVVEPLVTAMWGQGCYYNNMCPEDENGQCGHVSTGCLATAMGMIMHYWGFPTHGNGTYTYTPLNYPAQTANFGETTYDWVNMPDQLVDTSSQVEIDAVSELLWHCGVALDMQYNVGGSGAFVQDMQEALGDVFNYSCSQVEELGVNQYITTNQWFTKIKSNLDDGMPILYSGYTSNYSTGHAWVCDGYDADSLLHFNWGWYGSCNGYFAIGASNVLNYEFNEATQTIFDIHPRCDANSVIQITANVNNPIAGYVIGGGIYSCEQECTLTAVANEGYHFVKWIEAYYVPSYYSGLNYVISSDSNYSFYTTNDREITAVFAEEGETCNLVFDVYDSGGDGMNGCNLQLNYNDGSWENLTFGSGSFASFTREFLNTSHIEIWLSVFGGNYWTEISYDIRFENGVFIYHQPNINESLTNNHYEFDLNCEDQFTPRTIAAVANPENAGSVIGAGIYNPGDICTLTAVPNEEHNFACWEENGDIVSTDSVYTFVVEIVDRNLTANFGPYSIALSSNTDEGGTVIGGGSFRYGDTCTITAAANEGYVFLYWIENGNVISCSDEYSFMVKNNMNLMAIFAEEDIVCNIIIQFDGSYWEGIAMTVDYGDGNSETIIPGAWASYPSYSRYVYDGNHIEMTWSSQLVGWWAESYDVLYGNNSLIVHKSMEYNPEFQYEFDVDCSWAYAYHNITTEATPEEGGGIVGAGEYHWGDTCTLIATPNEGYDFLYWSENGALVSRDTSYSFMVNEDRSLIAHFVSEETELCNLVFELGPDNSWWPGNLLIVGYGDGVCEQLTTEWDENYLTTGYAIHTRPIINGNQITLGFVEDYAHDYCVFDMYYQNGDSIYHISGLDNNFHGVFYANCEDAIIGETYTITATANYSDGGTVEGGGYFSFGQTCTLTAIPEQNYIFRYWGKDGVLVSYSPTFSFNAVEDANYEAVFQKGILIGENFSGMCAGLPSESGCNYSFSKQIYTIDEISKSGTIESVAFYSSETSGHPKTRNYMVYFVNTTTNSFNTGDIAYSDEDLVFNGEVTMGVDCWSVIELDIPFVYDGNENLALIVIDNTNIQSGGLICRVFDTENCQAMSGFSWDTPFSPSTTWGQGLSYKNQVFFGGEFTIIPPHVVSATANPAEGGTVTGAGTYDHGAFVTLTATENEGYIFTYWKENGEVVSVESTYSFAVASDRNLVAEFVVSNGSHEYVDLGLPSGVLWATCNVGANTPESYGDYFAWGETHPKSTYSWSNYQFTEDDVATANWGTDWRMPTREEFEELCNNTSVTWTTQNGVNGMRFTALNGNCLFLPAAGIFINNALILTGSYGYYWSSSPFEINDDAWLLFFYSGYYETGCSGRAYGSSVRPVYSSSSTITQTTHFTTPGNWGEPSNWSNSTMPGTDAIVFIDAPCQLDQNATVAALTVSNGQSLTLLSDNTLTVTDTLVNADASGLVIKDGAQLIHSSEGVFATMEKNITGYTDDGGFCLLAVPFTDGTSVPDEMTADDYDLYSFDVAYYDAEWRNHKSDAFSLVRGQGYLYANSNDTTLTLTGQIPPTDVPFSASIFLYADANTFFNLLGNPFTCDAYLSDGRPYLVMNDDGTGLVLAEASAIPPMKGIFVEAVASEETVTFTTESPSKSIGRSVTLRLGSGEDANMEAVRVCFDGGDPMDKLVLNKAATRLYIPESGKNYTVTVAGVENRKPVNFKAGTDGVYTLTAEIENADLDYLHLIDNLTGEDIDLLALRRTQGTMSYTFVAKTSDPVARFTLAFGLKR